MQSEIMEEGQSTFKLLYRAQCEIDKIRKRAIILVGPTKQGKSTVFNWIYDSNALIGRKRGSLNYYGLAEEHVGVEINAKIKSVTVIPNSYHPDIPQNPTAEQNKQYYFSLIDAAGYNDNRNHSEVIGVSYMLKGILDRVSECKFVVVIQQTSILDYAKFFKSLRGFLNMFKLDLMNEDQKQNLYKSTTLLFTKAKSNLQTLSEDIELALENLEEDNEPKEKEDCSNEELGELLKYLIDNAEEAIHLFPMSKQNQPAPQCQLLDELREKREFFRVEQFNKQITKVYEDENSMFKLPFSRDFRGMSKFEQEQFQKKLNLRIGSFKEMTKIMKQFFDRLMEESEEMFSSDIDYSKQFKQIDTFLRKYDVYNKEEEGGPKFTSICSPNLDLLTQRESRKELQIDHKFNDSVSSIQSLPKMLELVKIIKKIYALVEELPDSSEESKSLQGFMEKMKTHTKKIFETFRDCFCKNLDQEKKVIKLLYIANKGYQEFSMLYEILEYSKSDMRIRPRDAFNSLFDTMALSDIEKPFVDYLSREESKEYWMKNTEYIEYLSYFKQKYPEFSNNDTFNDLFLHNVAEKVKKAKNKLKGKTKEEKFYLRMQDLKSLFELLENHVNISREKIEKQDEGNPVDKDYIYMTVIKIASLIGKQLTVLERNSGQEDAIYRYRDDYELDDESMRLTDVSLLNEQYNLALKIFTLIGFTEESCKVYEKILGLYPLVDYFENEQEIENDDESQNEMEEDNPEKEAEKQQYNKVMRFGKLQEYAEFCAENNRIEKAKQLYDQALGMVVDDMIQRKEIKEKIVELIEKQQEWKDNYKQKISAADTFNLNQNGTIQEILEELREKYIDPWIKYKHVNDPVATE